MNVYCFNAFSLRFCYRINHLLVLIACFPSLLLAQGTLEDYRRAEALRDKLKDKVYYAPGSFQWIEKTNQVWYLHLTPKGNEFVLVDAQTRTRKPAFDHEKLASRLSTAAGKTYEPYKLPFSTITFVEDGQQLEFIADSIVWRCSLETYTFINKGKLKTAPKRRYWGERDDELSNMPVKSPDSNWVAFVKNYNVCVASRKTQEVIQLSYDGSEGEYYSSYIEWSPDSKKLVTNKIRPNTKHLIYLIESSPADQLQPKLDSREYLKPGDALPVKTPHLFVLDTRKQLVIDNALFNHQFSVTHLQWWKDSRGFTFEYNQRGHQLYRILEVQANTGAVRPLIEEQSNTFIDYSSKKYRYDAEGSKEIIWASERDGWNHLYLYDALTGKVKNQITKGEWVVRKVEYVDEEKRTIIFAASGREKGQDPYLVQYYTINFDGKGLRALTSENANHQAVFSEDHQYFVDKYSRVDLPPVSVLRSAADGKVLMELEKADITQLEKNGWKAPEIFSAKGRDGKTDIWGIIIKPSHIDPGKKYPIIENIYAGPHNSFVPKSFYANYAGMQELAELGFIVVQIDGMGTSNRSKAFHDVCWKNLKDAGFPDRILWIKAAARKNPYMDISRVGIYGTSAGGQSAAGALIFHPEFYKAAVSSCGCHDNRMDKIWWNEQWMGYPVGEQYAACSNVNNAHKLNGKLLLILGELDDNVDPASTLQLVNALIKSSKDFDFLMVPGMGHSSGGLYGERKRRDFFVRHLLGVEPPAWSESMKASAGVFK